MRRCRRGPSLPVVSTLGDYVRLLLVVVPFIGAPGPGNIMCAAVGARYGPSRTIPFIVGLEVMVFAPAFAVGLGMGELLERAGPALDWLQVIGSLFIFYLAFRLLQDPPRPDDEAELGDAFEQRPPSFFDAVILQALNAKGAVVLIVIFAEFADGDDTFDIALRIAAVITAVSLVFHVLWLYLGQWIARRFSSRRALRIQGWIYATMLVTVAVWLLLV